MNFAKRFEQLCRERHETPTSLGAQLNFSKATVSKWRHGKCMPNNNSIRRLASFFDVSTDYLSGKSDIRNADKEYSDKEKMLLCVFGTTEVSPKAQNDLEKAIEMLRKKHHFKQDN